jgi:hypothetical protein
MSAIEWYKKHVNLTANKSRWGVHLSIAFEGEERYRFWRDIRRQEGEWPASFPPGADADTLEIARYEANRQRELPKEYTIALTFYNPIDGLRVRRSVFTSAQIREE